MTTRRATSLSVITAPTPAIIAGAPVLPKFWTHNRATSVLKFGKTHIHAIPDPTPKWNPATSGWYTAPPEGPLPIARWSVADLPDPGGGYYWLGDPTGQDGTAGITPAARQWAPDASTPHAPAWRSFFPYKPSVTAVDHYLQGGGVVHHPKGVNFNAHFIEHMWLDFGRAFRQPFTWVIAAMVASWPTTHYTHYLLDAGRNPDTVGFPRLSADAVNYARSINDALPYRSMISVNDYSMCYRTSNAQGSPPRVSIDAGLRPRMFFGVFNGTKSRIGYHNPSQRMYRSARLASGQDHRYYVLGRRQGWISQMQASHLLVFEIRFWAKALTDANLDAQYAQLSSSYQFDRYRAV